MGNFEVGLVCAVVGFIGGFITMGAIANMIDRD